MKKILHFILLLFPFLTTGQLIHDNSFGDNGFAFLSDSNSMSLIRSTIQPNGKIIVSGTRNFTPGIQQEFVMRLNSDGSVDNSFGTDGYYIINNAFTDANGPDIYLLSNGQLICVSELEHALLFFKLNVDGTKDVAFGVAGNFQLGANINISYAFDNDYLYVYTYGFVSPVGYIAKITKVDVGVGAIDMTFGTNGSLVIDSPFQRLHAVKANQFIAEVSPLVAESKLKRYHLDGSPDANFGINGELLVYHTDNPNEYFRFDDLSFGPDNSMYVPVLNIGTGTEQVQKFDADGHLITGFGNSGTIVIPGSLYPHFIHADSSKLTLAGAHGASINNYNLELLRYNVADGSVDETFNPGGSYIENQNGFSENAESVQLTTDGGILVTGEIQTGASFTATQIFVAKYIPSNLPVLQLAATRNYSFENPVADELQVFSADTIQSMDVFGIDGRFIKTVMGSTAPTSDLSAGVYLCRIASGKGLSTIRFVKN